MTKVTKPQKTNNLTWPLLVIGIGILVFMADTSFPRKMDTAITNQPHFFRSVTADQ